MGAVTRVTDEALDRIGVVSPRGRRYAVYTGAGLLGVAGLVEWPLAVTGAAVAWLTQPHTDAADDDRSDTRQHPGGATAQARERLGSAGPRTSAAPAGRTASGTAVRAGTGTASDTVAAARTRTAPDRADAADAGGASATAASASVGTAEARTRAAARTATRRVTTTACRQGTATTRRRRTAAPARGGGRPRGTGRTRTGDMGGA
ncbi:hypothetical protein [Streptomyces longispororuber]|nr:hypothetical protein [Streptomyces longispororuber]